MELKRYYAQDAEGNLVSAASCAVYVAGTQTLATIYNKNDVVIGNPLLSDGTGLIEFKAADGVYDLSVTANGRTYVTSVQCLDSASIVGFTDTANTKTAEFVALADQATADVTAARDVTTAARDEAVSAQVEIRNLYYGPLPADPTTRPDGTAMQVGDEYHHTGTNARMVFNGTAWNDFIVGLRTDLANATDPAKGAALIGRGGQVVPNIATLRTMKKDSASKYAEVLGYYSAGDGGYGSYYLDTVDTVSADNGGTVIVSADGGRWKLIHNGSVTVKQFGAKGDGVVDDTNPINAALAAVKTVYFPSGTYLISSTINFNQVGKTIIGDGRNTTTIKTTTVDVMFNVTKQDCGFYDITFDHAKLSNGLLRCISASDAYHLAVERCYFKMTPMHGSFGDIAISLKSSYWARISFVKVEFKSSSAVHTITGLTTNVCNGTGIYSENNNALFITDCSLLMCGRSIHLHDDDGATLKGISCEHFYQGIRLTGNSLLNTIEAVRCESHFENFVQMEPRSAKQCGVFLDTTTSSNVILGYIYSNYALYQPHGMGVIDEGKSNSWTIYSTGKKPLKANRPLNINGYLHEWNGSTPVGWSAAGATLSKELSDLPSEVNVQSALKISAPYNAAGAKTNKIKFNPAISRDVSVRFWGKRLNGTGVLRVGIWNEDTGAWAVPDFGLFNDYNLSEFSDWDSWQLYTLRGTINSAQLPSEANISFLFASKGSSATFLVAGVTTWHGALGDEGYQPWLPNPQLPGRREFYLPAAPTSGEWDVGDRVWNSAPTASSAPGWVCVTSGAPGTWKPMSPLGA